MKYRNSQDQSMGEVVVAFGGRWLLALGVVLLVAWAIRGLVR